MEDLTLEEAEKLLGKMWGDYAIKPTRVHVYSGYEVVFYQTYAPKPVSSASTLLNALFQRYGRLEHEQK